MATEFQNAVRAPERKVGKLVRASALLFRDLARAKRRDLLPRSDRNDTEKEMIRAAALATTGAVLTAAAALWLATKIARVGLVDNRVFAAARRRIRKNTNTDTGAVIATGGAYMSYWIAVALSLVLANSMRKGAAATDKTQNKTEQINDAADSVNTEVAADTMPQIQKTDWTKLYRVDTKAARDTLWKHAYPKLFESMMAVEVLVLDVHSDNMKDLNSVALGLSRWPAKGVLDVAGDWIPVKNHPLIQDGFNVSGNVAYNMTEAYFRTRENGRMFRAICNRLGDAELSINQFNAICGVAYNNETAGLAICDYVRDNWRDAVACAAFIANLPVNKVYGGIEKNRAYYALCYLNPDNVCEKIPALETYQGTNSKGKFYATTSVTARDNAEFADMKAELADGDTAAAAEMARIIVETTIPNGVTIREEILSKILNWNVPESVEHVQAMLDEILVKESSRPDTVHFLSADKGRN